MGAGAADMTAMAERSAPLVDSENELLTIPDVARILKVSRQQVYRYVWDGELALVKLGPKPNSAARIRRANVTAFIARHTDPEERRE